MDVHYGKKSLSSGGGGGGGGGKISLKFMNRARLVRLSRWWSLSFARYERRSGPPYIRRYRRRKAQEAGGVDRGRPPCWD